MVMTPPEAAYAGFPAGAGSEQEKPETPAGADSSC